MRMLYCLAGWEKERVGLITYLPLDATVEGKGTGLEMMASCMSTGIGRERWVVLLCITKRV